MNTEPDFDDKLEAIVRQLNTEAIARAGADATITNRLNALEKLVAEQGDDLKKRSAWTDANATLALTTCQELKREVAALKEAQSVAALALEVATMRETLSQLLAALSEEFEEDDGHTIEQVKAAYLAIVRHDADEVTVAHIEAADVLGDHGEEYRLINSTHDRSWTISKSLVADILGGEDDQ